MKIICWLLFLFLITQNCMAQLDFKVRKKPVEENTIESSLDSIEDADALAKNYKWYSKDSKRPDTNNIVIEMTGKAEDTMYLSTMPIRTGDLMGIRTGTGRSLIVHGELMIQDPALNTTYKVPIDNGIIMDYTCDRLMQLEKRGAGRAIISGLYFKDASGKVNKLDKTLVILP